MRTFFISILFSFSFTILFAQTDNIVILVDVSASVKKYISNPSEAGNAIADLIEAKVMSNGNFRYLPLSGSTITSPLASNGKKILIIPFGNKERDQEAASLQPTEIFNLSDVRTFLNSYYPSRYNDTKTYRTLALARTAQLAKKHGMETYWLFIVSDRTGDDFLGADAAYTQEQDDLIDSYNSITNKIDDTKIGFIQYLTTRKYKVDLNKIRLENYVAPSTSTAPTVAPPSTSAENIGCKIKLASYANGTSKIPVKVNSSQFSVSWSCTCQDIKAFRVGITGIGGAKVESQLRNRLINGNTVSFNLEDGQYRITVSAQGSVASSDQTLIEVSTGSSMWLLWFLLLLACIGVYLFLRNRSKSDPYQKNKTTKSKYSSGGTDLNDHFR